MGVGHSPSRDSAEAAHDAIAKALAGRQPKALLLFCSSSHDMQAVALAAQSETSEEVVVAGCSTAGEICGLTAASRSLVAIALGGEGFAVRSSVGFLEEGPREAGRLAAQALLGIESPHKALVLLSEGLGGLRTELIRGAYGVAGASVPLVGGCAGDDLALKQTFQLHRGQVLTQAVIGIAIGSNAPMSVAVGHGCHRISEPVVVTESDGTWIQRLNDEPALDYFLKAVNAPEEAYHSGDALLYGGLDHMLGLLRPGGEEIRATVGADYVERALLCGDVPKGTLVAIMKGTAESTLIGTQHACQRARVLLGEHEALGVLAFECVARLSLLNQAGLDSGLKIIAEAFPQAALGGFYTYGEFARDSGSRGIHNATLALLVLT
ncbi:FIST signal transduction protein [Halomonas sp. ANAO-440]|uniref:FIST signal transduction protein n=1 Tax=Halomonas sp. ANAO-440 TaxID=2861360 RepID=UPI0021CD2A6A|nr:FIST N-terminal domain-containing protein [Halomonas sp. ANAO-440]